MFFGSSKWKVKQVKVMCVTQYLEKYTNDGGITWLLVTTDDALQGRQILECVIRCLMVL